MTWSMINGERLGRLLESHRWNVAFIARMFQVHRSSVFKRMQKCGLRRPDNLKPFSYQKNKTHCPRGHSYSGKNLYVNPSGSRICRTCSAEKAMEKYNRKKKEEQDVGHISTCAQVSIGQ